MGYISITMSPNQHFMDLLPISRLLYSLCLRFHNVSQALRWWNWGFAVDDSSKAEHSAISIQFFDYS